jgi:Flp pilus assembly protein TadB
VLSRLARNAYQPRPSRRQRSLGRQLAAKSPKGLLMEILTDSKTFWLIMLCLFVFVALVSVGTVWMVVPIVLAICVLVLAIKFEWATIVRE